MARPKSSLMKDKSTPANTNSPRPRLHKMTIQNFRCIKAPVTIDLDDIVVLVGPNNVGKSSILRAYEVVMNEGSNEGKLTIDDFPNRAIDPSALPEIELETVVYDEPGDEWIREHNGEKFVRERWIWDAPAAEPKRQGFDVSQGCWSDKRPYGAANVANSRRPKPYKLSAFVTPEETSKQIAELLLQAAKDKFKNLQKGTQSEDADGDSFKELLKRVKELQDKLIETSAEQIDAVEKTLTGLISEIFPNHEVKFDTTMEEDLEKTVSLFKGTPSLLMGPKGGFQSKLENQGSGAQRTLMWSALRMLADYSASSGRPRVLLLDEPEICLHPGLVREACRTLYDLPQGGKWQVMLTTHSPVFIDFSRNNTTIVRVELENNTVKGTTVFRPERLQLSDDDKELLKLLNCCDPYVAEFFFGGNVIVVEGDTEYSALRYVISKHPERYRNLHVIRARGKATIVALIKILNQFGSSYAVLHDSDTPTAERDGKKIKNAAWTNNTLIKQAIAGKSAGSAVRLLVSVPNFEQAYLASNTSKDKPYAAVLALTKDSDRLNAMTKLVDALIDHTAVPPEGCIDWTEMEIGSLQEIVDAKIGS